MHNRAAVIPVQDDYVFANEQLLPAIKTLKVLNDGDPDPWSLEAARKTIKGTFEFLSSRGTHSSKPATEGRARFGIRATMSAMLCFVEHKSALQRE